MKQSDSIVKITTALITAQKSMGAAKKGATNPYFKSSYADLGDVMAVCKDALNSNGIAVLQPVMGSTVETVLLHQSGEWMASETPIVCKVANDPQALGSAITYARRYGLQSMVFIPAEDDDGNKAAQKDQPERKAWSKTESKPIPSSVGTGATVKATEKQVALIAILLGKKGRTDEELKAKYGVTSKKDLTMTQASQIIDNLSKLPDVPTPSQEEIVDPEEVERGMAQAAGGAV